MDRLLTRETGLCVVCVCAYVRAGVDPQDLSAYDLTALDSTQKKELVDEFVAGNGSGLQKMLTKLDGMLAKES